ncbi:MULTISPECIES: hypothetical protein [Streptomyces]|uniref:hypothetical protein n=1 Tax=Streptomyces TaxID=1883 RepID=UPI001F4883E3|nr:MULTISPECIES: hypothetical protein [Streptomyces]
MAERHPVGGGRPDHAHLSPLLVARLDAIDEEIHGLQGTRSSLAALVAATEGRQLAAGD